MAFCSVVMGMGEAAAQIFCFFAGGRLKHLAVGVEGHHLSGLFLLREGLVGARGARRFFLTNSQGN
jgi:hypothetical protein